MKENVFERGMNQEFEGLYKKYFMIVYKYIYREIGHKQIAEDLAQETFCVAYRKWRELEEHPSLQGWLLRTARNKMFELNRKVYRSSEVPLEENAQDIQNEEDGYGMLELEMVALATLEADEWKLVKKYYMQGYSVRELADSIGITENNLRVRLSRIIKKLKSGFE